MNSPIQSDHDASAEAVNPYKAPKTMDASRTRWLWIALGIALLLAVVVSAGVVTVSVLAINHVQQFDNMRRAEPPIRDPDPVPQNTTPESPPEPAS